MSPRAVKFLDQRIDRNGTGLEWGSGRSTAWFGTRVGNLVSVEYSPEWYERVASEVADVANVELVLCPLDHPEHEPTGPHYDVMPAYVNVAERFADESLSLVVVDGHYRQACIRVALEKLQVGSMLVIDDSDRLPSHEWGVPDAWPLVHESRFLTKSTSFWERPPN